MLAPMPTTPAEMIASIHARLAALDVFADTVPTAAAWVILSAHNLPLVFDVEGGQVCRPRVGPLAMAHRFRTMADAARVADACKDGNQDKAKALTLNAAIETVRGELEKTLAMFKDAP